MIDWCLGFRPGYNSPSQDSGYGSSIHHDLEGKPNLCVLKFINYSFRSTMPTLNEDVLQYCWYLCIYVGINFYVHLFASKNANILFIFLFVINYYFILTNSKFLRRLSPKGQLEKEILRGSWESGYTIQEKSQINNTSHNDNFLHVNLISTLSINWAF